MKITKHIWNCESGERVTSYCDEGKLFAQVIRRPDRKTWDVVYPPEAGRENLRGFRSKSRAEMYIVR